MIEQEDYEQKFKDSSHVKLMCFSLELHSMSPFIAVWQLCPKDRIYYVKWKQSACTESSLNAPWEGKNLSSVTLQSRANKKSGKWLYNKPPY